MSATWDAAGGLGELGMQRYHPWTSAVVSLCHVASGNGSSAPPATSTTKLRLHSTPPNPLHRPSHDGVGQEGERSQARGALGPPTRPQNPNSVGRPVGLEMYPP